MNPPIYLSIVIPAYREEKRIGATLSDLARYFRDKPYGYEVIVVDDGSPDSTYEAALGHMKELPGLRVERLPKNRGKGFAVRHGMRLSRGQYRLFMDADNSVRIDEVEAFIEAMEEGGQDVAIGSIAFSYSQTTEGNGWHRRILGSLSKMMIRVAAVPGIYDSQRGFKLFTAQAAETIFDRQTIHRFGFDIEVLLIANMHGFAIAELPVTWVNPPGSTVSLKSYLHSFVELARIFRNKARGLYDPEDRELRDSVGRWPRFLLELSYLPRRIWREVTDSPMHLHVKLIERGRYIVFGGKRFDQHSRLHYSETALYGFVRAQKAALYGFALAFMALVAIDWYASMIALIGTMAVVYLAELSFSAYLSARSFFADPTVKPTERDLKFVAHTGLPRVTALCPMYQESHLLPQFLESMAALDYPRDMLEILMLLEADDVETIEAVRRERLPDWFKTVVVPNSRPKTKSKALNYGLAKATGEYLVVFNPSDVPDPDQVKKALAAFHRSTEDVVCVQAKHDFYNVRQNLLTRLFAAEYSFTSDVVLPGVQSMNAPMPLMGSSDYFRTSALRELGGWDAFSVTEDVDLGIRLSKRGYRAAIIDSETRMEANSDLINWFEQRSRMIKGFILTFLVHTRNPSAFKGGKGDYNVFQAVVGGRIFAMFANLAFAALTATYFVFHPHVGLFVQIGALAYGIGNAIYMANYLVACSKKGHGHLAKFFPLAPLYWLCISLAAWRGVHEAIMRPHQRSAKTLHGLHLARRDARKGAALDAAADA